MSGNNVSKSVAARETGSGNCWKSLGVVRFTRLSVHCADKMTATVLLKDPGIFTFALEEVILKIENKEAILYLRGDKIRWLVNIGSDKYLISHYQLE